MVWASTVLGWNIGIGLCSSLDVGGLDFMTTFNSGSVFRVGWEPSLSLVIVSTRGSGKRKYRKYQEVWEAAESK